MPRFRGALSSGGTMKSSVNGSGCLGRLRLASLMGFFFALFLGAVYLQFLSVSLLPPILLYWAVVQMLLAWGMFCIYRLSGNFKHVFGGMLLVASGLITANNVLRIMPSLGLLGISIQALAIVSFSLLLYELGKARPGSGLELSGGLVFLGVIFQILQNPVMEGLGVFLLAAGFLLTSDRLYRFR